MRIEKKKVAKNEWVRVQTLYDRRYETLNFDPVIMAKYYDRIMPTFKNNPTMPDTRLAALARGHGVPLPSAQNTKDQRDRLRELVKVLRGKLFVHWVVTQILDPVDAIEKAKRDPHYWVRYRVLFRLREIEECAHQMAIEHPNDAKYQEILASIVNRSLQALPGKGGRTRAPQKEEKGHRLEELGKQMVLAVKKGAA